MNNSNDSDTDYTIKLLKDIRGYKKENAELKKIVLELNDRLAILEEERIKMLHNISILQNILYEGNK